MSLNVQFLKNRPTDRRTKGGTKPLLKSHLATKQGHRHKSRALVRENVKTCENL